jgi:hypothetical protein
LDENTLQALTEFVKTHLSGATIVPDDGTGEVVIRTGLTLDMGGYLYPLGEE